MDQLGVGIFPGVGVKKPVNIGEEHQQVGLTQPGHDGGEGIVVTQDLPLARLDLAESFSFTTGIQPISRRASKVPERCSALAGWSTSSSVRRIWATV